LAKESKEGKIFRFRSDLNNMTTRSLSKIIRCIAIFAKITWTLRIRV
jgi:hypothetical protein